MHIQIASRLRPYSHQPGTMIPLPGSFLTAQIFPALLRLYDCSSDMPELLAELSLAIEGPVGDFTAQLDLERGSIKVWGHGLQGYFLYSIMALPKNAGAVLCIEKCTQEIIVKKLDGFEIQLLRPNSFLNKILAAKDELIMARSMEGAEAHTKYSAGELDRLSLGSHKAQDWQYVRRRLDLKEILPAWRRLGQMVPQIAPIDHKGTAGLLRRCQEHIQGKDKNRIVPELEKLFMAGFEGLLSPRLHDDEYQGIIPFQSTEAIKGNPFFLLSEGAKIIQDLFFQSNGDELSILPVLPPEFPCGRLINLSVDQLGSIDLEWSKKMIRRLVFRPFYQGEFLFNFEKDIRKFRLREKAEKTQESSKVIHRGAGIKVKPGTQYFFDNFER